jgi:ribosomal protein L13
VTLTLLPISPSNNNHTNILTGVKIIVTANTTVVITEAIIATITYFRASGNVNALRKPTCKRMHVRTCGIR